jgi:serine/threonine protein phosphatase 1
MSRTLAIGDIHGGLKGLVQVLAKAAATPDDKFIFLGDYVDGWSDSAKTISFLIKFSQQYDCIFIKGNHDVWCEHWLRTGEADYTWLRHGGQSTMKSYDAFDEFKKDEHLLFFEQMKLYHHDTENRLFVHAGFVAEGGPEQEIYTANLTTDRTMWEMALTMDKRIKTVPALFPRRLKLFREIYIGHTPTIYYAIEKPMQGCNVWNVDTGAAFTGRLTAMDIDTKVFWQSDRLKDLYAGESGRNRD